MGPAEDHPGGWALCQHPEERQAGLPPAAELSSVPRILPRAVTA